MTNSLSSLVEHYSGRYGDGASTKDGVRLLYEKYVKGNEASLVDAVAATSAINALFFSDQIDSAAINPQMMEAASLQWGDDLDSLLERLQSLDDKTSPGARNILSQWKGKYFEVVVRDKLNAGESVGGIHLGPGQTASLAGSVTQPGWDLQIADADGEVAEELQLKATASLGYVRQALERYPDIPVIATDEVADQVAGDLILSSGISNVDLEASIGASVEDVLDTSFEDLTEAFLSGLPLVLIPTIEGAKVLIGRQTLRAAVNRSVERGIKTGASMAVGGLLALAGAGIISLPATFVTRLSIDRYRVQSGLLRRLQSDVDSVRALKRKTGESVK